VEICYIWRNVLYWLTFIHLRCEVFKCRDFFMLRNEYTTIQVSNCKIFLTISPFLCGIYLIKNPVKAVIL